jgi:Pyruvate/2-oxoacid:ferredoxin oxidoreductase delta subunit
MGIRKVVEIDEEKCDGCGECVTACAEGAIQIIDGKAKLVSDVYCDGLGACLGDCPQDAIAIVEREAADFDEEAVKTHLARLNQETAQPSPAAPHIGHSCPGSAMRQFDRPAAGPPLSQPASSSASRSAGSSQLGQWPVQLMLVPPAAPFLKDADILICADCVPFAVPDFHQRYLAGRALLVGCPKLDDLQHYFEKLKEIFITATPRKLTVLKMEVPCCNGIAQATVVARNQVAPEIPVEVHTIGIRGGAQCEKLPAGTAA